MVRHYNLARTSSLARSSREEVEQPAAQGLSLNDFYLGLGKVAKADLDRGLITQSAFISRLQTLRTEYATLKGVT